MKEQELQLEKIFDTIQLVSQSNSAVFQEYSRLDKGKANPLSSLMVDNLKLLSQDFLFTKMPELCDIINKTASEQLINWLIEQPSFQQWLSPADKLFFDYFQSTNKRQEIFKSTFFNCEEHKDDKNKSFILDSCFNSSIGADYTILAKDKFDEDLWKNVIETFDSNKKEQKKFVTKMIEEIKNADKPTTLDNIFTVFMVTMNKDILSQKEADILFTSQLVNKSDSLLMPKSKLEKIEYAINIKVHLDFQFLQKYHKEPYLFEKSILEKNSTVFERVAQTNPDFDIKYWYDKDNLIKVLEKSSEAYNKENIADRFLDNLKEKYEYSIAAEKKQMLDDVMAQFPNHTQSNNEDEPKNSQHFKI